MNSGTYFDDDFDMGTQSSHWGNIMGRASFTWEYYDGMVHATFEGVEVGGLRITRDMLVQAFGKEQINKYLAGRVEYILHNLVGQAV